MDDLISRQAAIDVINKYILSFDAIDANFLDGLKTTIKLIKEDVPSVQPERKNGKWEKKWHSYFKQELPCCSVCGHFSAMRWKYCPECGADMR